MFSNQPRPRLECYYNCLLVVAVGSGRTIALPLKARFSDTDRSTQFPRMRWMHHCSTTLAAFFSFFVIESSTFPSSHRWLPPDPTITGTLMIKIVALRKWRSSILLFQSMVLFMSTTTAGANEVERFFPTHGRTRLPVDDTHENKLYLIIRAGGGGSSLGTLGVWIAPADPVYVQGMNVGSYEIGFSRGARTTPS